MIKRVRTEPLFHRIGPLLVRDSNVSNWPPDRSPQSFGHFFDRGSFADQSVRVLRWRARMSQQSCSDPRYIFCPDERNHRGIRSPRQEDGTLLSDASTDERAHVFVVGRGLEMNGAHLRPIEDAIGQPMLQIAEAGSTIQIAIREIAGPALIL